MAGAIGELLKHLVVSHKPDDCDEDTLFVDSMPITTCCGRSRKGRVAREIADNGFWNEERISKNNELLTPVKAVKGATEAENRGTGLLATSILLLSLP